MIVQLAAIFLFTDGKLFEKLIREIFHKLHFKLFHLDLANNVLTGALEI